MKLVKPALLATAIAVAGASAPAPAQAASDAQSAIALLQRLVTHYAMLAARSFVDLTWEQLSVEPGTNQLIISGLKLYPTLDWDADGKCEITIDRIMAGDSYSFETVSTGWEISGISVPTACLDPGAAGPMSMFGYDAIDIDAIAIEVSYSLPDSAAELVIQTSVRDVADISVSVGFDYLWFNVPLGGYGGPMPVVQLGEAEIAIVNRGIWERMEPMLGQQIGDLNAVPQIIKMQLGQLLSEGGGRTPSDAENAFIENLAAEVGRFIKEKNSIVFTAAPAGGVWLDESVFDSPQNLIAALQPRVSGTPAAHRRIIPPAEMMAALTDAAAPDDATRLRIGRALITGIGAPRSLEDGGNLLEPLARNWNGEAALLIAEAAAGIGRDKPAYEAALLALGGGEMGALGVADSLEAKLPVADVLAMQDAIGDGWPGAGAFKDEFTSAVSAGDIGQIRKFANAAAVGRGLPRSYAGAYMLATLAAAGGDRSAASLRDRLDRRFSGDEAWTDMTQEASKLALTVWTNGGFGAAITARIK